jgi:hypothetical protein
MSQALRADRAADLAAILPQLAGLFDLPSLRHTHRR